MAGDKMNKSQLRTDIEHAINCNSAENGSDTPDFILAEYLLACLEAFDKTVKARSQWYNHHCTIGGCNHLETKSNLDKCFATIEGHSLNVSSVFVPEGKDGERLVEDIKSWNMKVGICPNCREPYSVYGCQEGMCKETTK
jgi:hypothetical protein